MTAIDAQLADDVGAIKALIQAFFDAINAEDTEALQARFFPRANLTIIRQDPPMPPPPSGGGDGDGGDDDDDGHRDHAAWRGADSTTQGGDCEKEEDEDEKEDKEDGGEEKLTVVIRTSIEAFIRLLEDDRERRKHRPGNHRQPVLHETPDLGATEVRVDGLFGVAWSPFRVTFDGALHHYGTMVYTLGGQVVSEDGDDEGGKKEKKRVWRVEGLTQNYRRTPGWSVAAVGGEEEGSGLY